MTVDYDLVVIGGSSAGRYAAITAARLQARVALVEPQLSENQYFNNGIYERFTLNYIGQIAQQLAEAHQFGIYGLIDPLGAKSLDIAIKFPEIMEWVNGVVANIAAESAPAGLALLGVDLLFGTGQFCRTPHLAFQINDRWLRSRTYLLAPSARSLIPEIEGLAQIGYLTSENLNLNPQTLNLFFTRSDPSLIIIGGTPAAIELAQTFTRLGARVILIVSTPQILPTEDPEVAGLIQAQLEAEGVRILTKTLVTQAKQIQDKKWIQAGDQAIEADEILVAIGTVPDIESLNLAAVNVKFGRKGIKVNAKLQTTNPKIYACSSGNNIFSHLAKYEANLIIKNTLFLSIHKIDYRYLPIAIFTDPALARVGLTESIARQQYGNDIIVLKTYFNNLAKSQISSKTTGFCKILVRRNGTIIGASIIGVSAEEIINAIALAMTKKLKIEAIANSAFIEPTVAEIISKTAMQWKEHDPHRNSLLQNLRESYFNLCRSWSS